MTVLCTAQKASCLSVEELQSFYGKALPGTLATVELSSNSQDTFGYSVTWKDRMGATASKRSYNLLKFPKGYQLYCSSAYVTPSWRNLGHSVRVLQANQKLLQMISTNDEFPSIVILAGGAKTPGIGCRLEFDGRAIWGNFGYDFADNEGYPAIRWSKLRRGVSEVSEMQQSFFEFASVRENRLKIALSDAELKHEVVTWHHPWNITRFESGGRLIGLDFLNSPYAEDWQGIYIQRSDFPGAAISRDYCSSALERAEERRNKRIEVALQVLRESNTKRDAALAISELKRLADEETLETLVDIKQQNAALRPAIEEIISMIERGS